MNLSAPRQIYFLIAVIIAIIAVVAAFVPSIAFIAPLWIMTIAFVILAVACLIRGA